MTEREEAEAVLRVGRIPFLVCAPYFHASLDGLHGVQFTDGPPRALNTLLAAGEIDCAPSSSFEYARHADDYVLLPGLCTSGRGEVRSVLLLSDAPWERLDGKPVLLSPDSDTSNALARVLSHFRFDIAPRFLDAAPEDGTPLAGKILIGDAALREAATGRWEHRTDLAKVWHDWRGTPLPFGVWIVREEIARSIPAAVRTYREHLGDSLRAFFADPAARLSAWGTAHGLPLSRADALDFFSTADYALTPAHEQALRDFFALCTKAGLLPAVPELRWVT